MFIALAGISSGAAPPTPPTQTGLQTDPVLNWTGLHSSGFHASQGYHEAVGQLVVGDFTGNGRPDAVTVLDGSRAALTQDVAERHGREVLQLYGANPAEVPITALALHPGGGAAAGQDSLLSAGTEGVHHWRWDDVAQAMLASPVTSAGIEYVDVVIASGDAGGIRLAYALQRDRATVDILLFLGASGDFFMHGGSFVRADRIQAIECVDFAGDGVAECAVLDDRSLAIHNFQGVREYDVPHGLTALQHDLLGSLKDANKPDEQLAWLHHGQADTEIRTLEGTTLWGPTAVPVALGLALSTGDQTGDGLADIAIVGAGQGTLHLFDALNSGGAVRYDSHMNHHRAVTTVPVVFPAIGLASDGGAAIADLDGDGDMDVLQSHSSSAASYLLIHRADAEESTDDAPDLTAVTLSTMVVPGLDPALEALSMDVELAAPANGAAAGDLHIRVWHRDSLYQVQVEETPIADRRVAAPTWPYTLHEEITLPIADRAIWYVEAFLRDPITDEPGPVATFVVSFDSYTEMVTDALPGERLWGGGGGGSGGDFFLLGRAATGSSGGTRVIRIPPPPPPPPPAPPGPTGN